MDVGEKAVSGMRLTEGCWKALEHGAGVLQMCFVYGNYIDEVLMMRRPEGQYSYDYFYVHDHLYSPAALIDAIGVLGF